MFEILNAPKFNKNLIIFNFGTNSGLTGGKYLIKIIFDNKIKIDIVEISTVSNFNKCWPFLDFGTNLGLTGGKYVAKIIFHIKIEISIFEISIRPDVDKF